MNNQNPLFQLLWATANEQQKTILNALAANANKRDFYDLQDVLNGRLGIPYIYKNSIDNAEEYYKHLNKALLVFRNLQSSEKYDEENRIDVEAKNLKSQWIKQLKDRNITIIDQNIV